MLLYTQYFDIIDAKLVLRKFVNAIRRFEQPDLEVIKLFNCSSTGRSGLQFVNNLKKETLQDF